MHIEAETLGAEFAEYLRGRAGLRCFQMWPRFSAENWFQVELWTHLTQRGEAVVPAPQMPGDRFKADLGLRSGDRFSIFIEMKCLVQGADAKKSAEFRQQLDRLERLVREGSLDQGVALATFGDYGSQALVRKIAQQMQRPGWTTGGRRCLTERMVLVISTYP